METKPVNTERELFISINHAVIGKDKAAVKQNNGLWVPHPRGYYTPDEFIQQVTVEGHAFSSIFKDNYRKGENYSKISGLFLDFDNETPEKTLTLKEALQHPYIKEHAYLIYTSPNHLKEKHTESGNILPPVDRYRVVFVAEQVIEAKEDYEAVIRGLMDLFPQADSSAKDAARFFYGTVNAQVYEIGETLSPSELGACWKRGQDKRIRIRSIVTREQSPSGSVSTSTGSVSGIIDYTSLGLVLNGTHEYERAFLPGTIPDGTGRHRTMVSLASFLGRKYSREVVREEMSRINEDKLEPPYNNAEVDKIVDYAFDHYVEEGTKADIQNGPFGRNYTEADMGEYLAEAFDGNVKYNHTTSEWMIWTDSVWERDVEEKVRREALRLVNKLHTLTSEYQGGAQETFSRFVFSFQKRFTLDNALVIARGNPLVSVTENRFDTDPYLFNMVNGTYNLKTDTFMSHSRQDLCSKQAGVAYDPTAGCPKWLEFVDLVFAGDRDLIEFIQTALGYSLSGLVNEKMLFFCYGPKADNGKTTLFTTFQNIMGDYAKGIPTDSLMMSDRVQHSHHNAEVLSIRGSRFIGANEVQQGRRLDESLVKDLCGGDKIFVRGAYDKKTTGFTPVSKLWMFGNHKPEIRGTDNAIWNRVTPIPFDVIIPLEKRLPREKVQEMFQKELSGIFNWLLEGWARYKNQDKIIIPPRIRQENKAYREEMDSIGTFLGECIEVTNKGGLNHKDLFGAYEKWCKVNNEFFFRRKQFVNALTERGFHYTTVDKNRHSKWWSGIAFTEEGTSYRPMQFM